MSTAVEQYLSVGLVADSERADRYLDRLLAGPDPGDCDPATLLATILAESLPGSPDVVIPLSGGNDSRGVLGAAMSVLPTGAITCITVGQSDGPEWRIASAACRRNGIRQEQIDPDTFVWDLDEMVELAREIGRSGAGVPLIDTYFSFVQLAKRIGPGIPILSGYLGDAISGKHLEQGYDAATADAAARRFVWFNIAAINGARRARLVETFAAFVEANEQRRSPYRSLTRFDLLDFGFRQAHRIRAAISGPFAHCIRPYEDPRWIRFWFQRPIAERLDQSLYLTFLRSAYPTIFDGNAEESPSGRMPLMGRSIGRGDPCVNPTIIPTLRRAAESFDRRRLAPIKFLPTVELLATDPSDAGYVRARWVLSAEVQLRAGLL